MRDQWCQVTISRITHRVPAPDCCNVDQLEMQPESLDACCSLDAMNSRERTLSITELDIHYFTIPHLLVFFLQLAYSIQSVFVVISRGLLDGHVGFVVLSWPSTPCKAPPKKDMVSLVFFLGGGGGIAYVRVPTFDSCPRAYLNPM